MLVQEGLITGVTGVGQVVVADHETGCEEEAVVGVEMVEPAVRRGLWIPRPENVVDLICRVLVYNPVFRVSPGSYGLGDPQAR